MTIGESLGFLRPGPKTRLRGSLGPYPYFGARGPVIVDRGPENHLRYENGRLFRSPGALKPSRGAKMAAGFDLRELQKSGNREEKPSKNLAFLNKKSSFFSISKVESVFLSLIGGFPGS